MEASIIVLIVIFSVIGLLLIFSSIFLLTRKDKMENYEMILFFIEVDLKNWRIRKNNLIWNENLENEKFDSYFRKKIGTGWISISKLFEILGPEEEKKWKQAIKFCVENKETTFIKTEINFKSLDDKKTFDYFFNVSLFYINDSKIHIELMSQDKASNKFLSNFVIKKEELLKCKNQYQLFTAFSIYESDMVSSSNSFISFIREALKVFKIKNISFFKSNAIYVIVFSSDKYSKITKTKRKIQRQLIKSNKKSTINNYFNGITFVESESIKNKNDFSKIMTRISFGLIKSRNQNEPIHFNLKSIKFNEFEKFKEKIVILNDYVEKNKFDCKIESVFSVKSNKHLFDYYLPKIDLKDDFWNKSIIKINEFDNKINDKFVIDVLRRVERSQDKDKIIININDYQIEKQFEKMKKIKNIIYIIHRVKYTNSKEFNNLLKLLEKSEIKFGVYIDDFDSNVLSIIGNVKPEILVISNKFNSNLLGQAVKNKLRVMDAIIMTERFDITLMFVGLDEEMRKEVKILSKKEKLYIANDFDI